MKAIQESCLVRTQWLYTSSHLGHSLNHSPVKRFPELSCVRKETVDIDIFVTSRSGNKKSYNLLE